MTHADSADTYLRNACFVALDGLRARFPDDLPMRHGLAAGFTFDGARVPFLNPQKGSSGRRASPGRRRSP